VVQAADYFLRQETGQTDLSTFRYHQHQNGNGSQWRVQFTGLDGVVHEVVVDVETAVPDNLLASCGKLQVKPTSQYTYLTHSVIRKP
jgi:hypothetical protein